MVVDALMQIPWLVAIVNAVVWVGKAVWDFIGKSWRMVALWFSTAIPIVLRWARERLAHRLLVVGLWLSLVTICWSALVQLLARVTVRAVFPAIDAGFLSDFIWSDPVNLGTAWGYISDLWGFHMAALSLRILWLRVNWAMKTGQSAI